MLILLSVLGLAAVLFLFLYFIALTGTDRRMLFQKHRTLTHNGIERQYRVRLPAGYDETKQYPLVFAFHGYLDRSKQLEFYSGLSNLGQEESFIAVYPEGVKRSWNGGICCGYAFENDVDDVGFIDNLLTVLGDQYAVDKDKVYAIGFSNGGVLTARLIQELPDTFAGAAMVMSSFGTEEKVLSLSEANTPLILLNGTDDLYIPRDADALTNSFNFIPLDRSDELLRQSYACPDNPEISESDRFIHKTYRCDSARLETYLYKDTAHVWPGWRVMHPFTSVPDSTRTIWEFLKKS